MKSKANISTQTTLAGEPVIPELQDRFVKNYTLFDNVYLLAYEEFKLLNKKYSDKECQKYFRLKIQGSLKKFEKDIKSQPLNLRKEFAELSFRSLQFNVDDVRKMFGKHYSPKTISSKFYGTINEKEYAKFYTAQENAFDIYIQEAMNKKERIFLDIDIDLFNEKAGKNIFNRRVTNSDMIWQGDIVVLKSFHTFLIKKKLIEEIPFDIFQRHFSGFCDTELIRWIGKTYLLPITLNEVYKYMNPLFYPTNKSCSPSTVAIHFEREGKHVKETSISNYKKQVPGKFNITDFRKELNDALSIIPPK